MATVKLGALVTHIKGSVSGTTFQSSATGLTMRNKPINVGAGTHAQSHVRNINAILNNYWTNLTDAQRSVWASFSNYTNGVGTTNQRKKSANTGKTQFFAVNFWLIQYGKPVLITPTITTPLAAVTPCPPYYTQSSTLINYTGTLDATQEILVTRVSLPQSLATNTANTGLRTLVYLQSSGDSQNWFPAYQNVFGILPSKNKKYWIYYQIVNFVTGAISPVSKALVLYTDTPGGGIGSMIIGSTFIVG